MTINLRTEVTIDVDEKRKLWITTLAENVQIEDVAEVTDSMAGKMIQQTTDAFERLNPVINREPGPAGLDRSRDPRSVRTFQEEPGEE